MLDIVLDGPGKNSLGTPMLRWLRGQLEEAGGRPVLLTGAGDAFCAGLDLREVASLDADGMVAFLTDFLATVRALLKYPGPTVALVNGHAIAGGAILALCCDASVAADQPRARIGLNEVALGLRFPPWLLATLRARVPPRHHVRVFLEGGLHDPHTAAALGLVTQVSDDATRVARERLDRLSASPAAAYAACKHDLLALSGLLGPEEPLAEDVVAAWIAPELKERLRAALRR